MVEKTLIDGDFESVVNIPKKLDERLTLDLRKKEIIEAIKYTPLTPFLYLLSEVFEEENNRIGVKELSKGGFLRGIGIILNSEKMYERSLVHFNNSLNYLNLMEKT